MSASERPSVDWESIVAATSDGIGILEGERFVHVDDRFAAYYGYEDPDEVLGSEWGTLCARDDRDRFDREVLTQIAPGSTWRGEAVGRRAGGTTFRHELSVHRTDGGLFVWAVQEAGDGAGGHGRAGDDSRAGSDGETVAGSTGSSGSTGGSADQYRRLFDAAPVPIGVFTAGDGIVYCNGAAVEFLGADDREDVLGRSPETFVPPEDRERVARRIERVLSERESTPPLEERLVGLGGQERVAVVSSAPVTYDGMPAAQVVMNDVTDHVDARARLRQERRFVENVVDVVDDIVYVIDEDGEGYRWNETLVETTGYTHDEIEEMSPVDFVPEDQHEYVPGLLEAIEDIDDRRIDIDLVTSDGERITHEFKGTTFEDPETGDVYRCGLARDITERLERERALERQRDELETLDRLNQLLLEVVDALVGSTTREAVERTVCERLAGSDLYRFAWTGASELDGDRVVPRTSAGDGDGYLSSVTIRTDGPEEHDDPIARALATGAVQVANVDASGDDPWRREAFDRGFRSVVAVPLRHRETVYGVLVVHAARPNAFSERKQRGFSILGEAVGFAINAVKHRRLLFADAVTELEFRVSDAESFLARASSDHRCRLSVPGHVSADDRWLVYVDVDGASAGRIVEAAAGDPTVERSRIVEDREGAGRVELIVSDSSFIPRTIPTGVQVRSLAFEDGAGRLVVDAPADVEVREVVAGLDSTFDTVELFARQERDRPPGHSRSPRDPLDGLTDRQRETLEVAHRAGYFAWPRSSSAEEVADALGIAVPTFLAHLRKGEDGLISTLFG